MNRIQEKQVLQRILNLMKEWMGAEGEVDYQPGKKGCRIDMVQRVGNWTFAFEHKNSGAAPAVIGAVEQLNRYTKQISENVIPVVAVPFMGGVGQRLCQERGISWLDLSGNADIKAPGLKIYVEGKPNQFKSTGRPKDIFAPKSSRITRHLLIDPEKFITQRELTQATSLDEGLVSRVVREMEKAGLLIRNSAGGVKPKNPNILLDSWREKYSFAKHKIIKGFVAERSGSQVVKSLTEAFRGNNLIYALTGLSAAWQLSKFATYRTSTIYLIEEPSDDLLKNLRFTKEDKGSNVWLVVPNDEGVFDGAAEREGICCAHPVQVYLDLKDHPERAREAAEELRKQHLNWGSDAE